MIKSFKISSTNFHFNIIVTKFVTDIDFRLNKNHEKKTFSTKETPKLQWYCHSRPDYHFIPKWADLIAKKNSFDFREQPTVEATQSGTKKIHWDLRYYQNWKTYGLILRRYSTGIRTEVWWTSWKFVGIQSRQLKKFELSFDKKIADHLKQKIQCAQWLYPLHWQAIIQNSNLICIFRQEHSFDQRNRSTLNYHHWMDWRRLQNGRINVLEHDAQWFSQFRRNQNSLHWKHHLQLHRVHERAWYKRIFLTQAPPDICH